MDFITKNILILVKTYPSLSKKYKELVCTAGMDEDGNWFRLYPIPFRFLTDDKRFEKYRCIKVKLLINLEDCRVESYKVIDYQNKLAETEDVAICVVSFDSKTTIVVDSIGYIGYNLIRFVGKDNSDKPLELVQHVSQLNFFLMPVQKPEPETPKRKIGFVGQFEE